MPATNKTLVIVIASTRSGHITWLNFEENVLKHLNADLALAIAREPEQHHKMFHHQAKYLWEIDEPEDHDFSSLYNEVSEACYQHPFDLDYAKVIGNFAHTYIRGSGWLGCVKATNQKQCSGALIYFRYFALQQMLYHKLYEIYDKVIITRSDYLFVDPHANIDSIARNEIGVPNIDTPMGLIDRHQVFTMYDAINTFDLLEIVFERKDPHDQAQYLLGYDFDSLRGNLESVMWIWHRDMKNMDIRTFMNTAFIVMDVSDNSRFTEYWVTKKVVSLGGYYVLAKYEDEYQNVLQNREMIKQQEEEAAHQEML
jgi:hypothetical protein